MNRDIFNLILDEVDVINLVKLSKLNKKYHKKIEKHFKKIYINQILKYDDYTYMKHIINNFICHYCNCIINFTNYNKILEFNACNDCYITEVYMERCDYCGERDQSKLKFRPRSTYCSNGCEKTFLEKKFDQKN